MRKLVIFISVMAFALAFLAACGESGDVSNREKAVSERDAVFAQAVQVAPNPHPVNFPIRKALVKFTERQDQINHPWYIYILGMDGTYVGYFVGQTYPVNACNFLSSSEAVRDDNDGGNLVLTAPSLDGIYYGGGGASSNCNSYFFFDAETDAMQTFVAPMWFASDVPLDLDVPRLSNTAATPTP